MERSVIEVEHSGEWMPVETLREAALKAVVQGNDVTLNLKNIDHLDASALQILLALEIEQKKLGRQLDLTHVSPQLRQCFEYSGAVDPFFPIAQENDE